MIKAFLNSFEDPRMKLLGPNYWLLKKMGLILPENKAAKIAYILLHEIVAFFVLTQYMELYVIRSNLDLVLTNLKISMLSIVCTVKANTFVFWQVSWKEVIEYATRADQYERENQSTARHRITCSYTNYCRRIVYFYCVLVFTTFITVTTTPLMRYLSSASYREGLSNGTELFPHIFSSWMPFDKYSSPGSWITVLWHVALCAYGAGIMAAYDTIIMVIMVFFGGKLELLRERCKHMFDINDLDNEYQTDLRIQELYNIHVLLMKYLTTQSSALRSLDYTDFVPNFTVIMTQAGWTETLVSLTDKDGIRTEHKTFGYSRLFNSLLSPVMFLYVVMCSLMLCASAVQLTSATNATQKLLMAEYLVFGIAQLFLFCWHSNDVLIKSQQVMIGPYESNWIAAHSKQSRNVLILAGQLSLVHTYTAGPFTQLTLSTFITILKGAYSYYTLLRE